MAELQRPKSEVLGYLVERRSGASEGQLAVIERLIYERLTLPDDIKVIDGNVFWKMPYGRQAEIKLSFPTDESGWADWAARGGEPIYDFTHIDAYLDVENGLAYKSSQYVAQVLPRQKVNLVCSVEIYDELAQYEGAVLAHLVELRQQSSFPKARSIEDLILMRLTLPSEVFVYDGRATWDINRAEWISLHESFPLEAAEWNLWLSRVTAPY